MGRSEGREEGMLPLELLSGVKRCCYNLAKAFISMSLKI